MLGISGALPDCAVVPNGGEHGCPAKIGEADDETILARLLALNLERALA
jgi:hypothetical protein